MFLRPKDRQGVLSDPAMANYVAGFLRHAAMFDVTETEDLVPLVKEMPHEEIASLMFLPAPVTWLEFGSMLGVGSEIDRRIVFVCTKQAQTKLPTSENAISVYMLTPIRLVSMFIMDPGALGAEDVGVWIGGPPDLPEAEEVLKALGFTDDDVETQRNYAARLLITALVAINSPKIVEFEPQQPSKLLERKLMDARVFDRNRPSSGWTRITLGGAAVGRPTETDSTEHTGPGKRLHYCRAHIRIARGKLQRVTGHWRGNAELGRTRAVYSFKNKTA